MRYLALILIALSMSAGATTPVVSNVTGTVATGQTLTITGTTMMDSDTANWDFSESASSFEGASSATDGWTADIGTLVTNVKLLGSKSLHQQYTGLWSGPDGHPGRFYRTRSSMKPPFWVRAYVRTDSNTVGNGSWPDTYHKLFSHYGSGANSVFVDWQVFGGGSPPTVLTFIDTGNHATNSIVFQELKWHCVEMRFPSRGSPNVQVYWDGKQIYSATSSVASSDTAANLEFDTNRGSTGAGYGQERWFDGVVVSSTRVNMASRVEVSDSATYGAGTLVYQFPTSISDTSQQVIADLTGLGAGPYYLYVTNNRGETSAAYYLSGGGDTTRRP